MGRECRHLFVEQHGINHDLHLDLQRDLVSVPIVTGAALAVQGVLEAAGGSRLSPAQMRQVLSDAATGTASNNPAADQIGVMPNLRAIIEGTLNIGLSDPYIRDNTSDTGDPHTGSISTSPDVILRPNTVPNLNSPTARAAEPRTATPWDTRPSPVRTITYTPGSGTAEESPQGQRP